MQRRSNAYLRRSGEKWAFPFSGRPFRKSFCTNAILMGIDLESLRVLMGHSNLTMISKHYSKISKNDSHMRMMAEKASLRNLSLSFEDTPPAREAQNESV